MTDSTRQHLIRYPNARTSTVIYLRKRDETTERLRSEIAMNSRPKSETTIRAMMRGIAALMAKIGGGNA